LENAVKHNIISKTKPLTVNIYMNGDDYLVIENNLQLKIRPEKNENWRNGRHISSRNSCSKIGLSA
jgi:hypothetical protein